LAGNATYSVVKNTLSKIAAREAGLEALEPLLEGPSAIAFVSGDPVEVAKGLRAFNREHPLLVIKGGVLDGATISADDIRKLADLESREVLLAKLAGGFLAPATQLVNVLAAPMRQLAQLLGALQAKAADDPNWAGGPGSGGDDAGTAEPVTAASGAASDAASGETAAPIEDTPADAAPATQSEAATASQAPATVDTPADSEPAADAAAPDPSSPAATDETATAEPTTDQTDGVADASSDS
jgi:large subunit ribosomal protein L10